MLNRSSCTGNAFGPIFAIGEFVSQQWFIAATVKFRTTRAFDRLRQRGKRFLRVGFHGF